MSDFILYNFALCGFVVHIVCVCVKNKFGKLCVLKVVFFVDFECLNKAMKINISTVAYSRELPSLCTIICMYMHVYTYACISCTMHMYMCVLIQDQRKWHFAKLVETGKEDAPVAIPDDNGGAVSGSKGRSKGRKREEHTPVGKQILLTIIQLYCKSGNFCCKFIFVVDGSYEN